MIRALSLFMPVCDFLLILPYAKNFNKRAANACIADT